MAKRWCAGYGSGLAANRAGETCVQCEAEERALWAAPPQIDTSVPHPARRYDYLLGGKDNFAADRASADELIKAFPAAKTAAIENRNFLRRVVGWLAREQRIGQFLDIGTGIPTSPNTHEVAQAINPGARIVYVDNDPLVLVHARALLTSITAAGRTAYLGADLTRPRGILDNPDLKDTLDLSQPVGLLIVAVLHFLPDDTQARDALAELVAPLASGSYVVASHTTYDPLPDRQRRQLEGELARTDRHGEVRPRSLEQLESLFGGLRLESEQPGLVSTLRWTPHLDPRPGEGVTEADAICYAYVARRP